MVQTGQGPPLIPRHVLLCNGAQYRPLAEQFCPETTETISETCDRIHRSLGVAADLRRSVLKR